MARDAGIHPAGDVVQGIGAPGVFREGAVGVIGDVFVGIQDHVLQNRAEADSIPDLRLMLPGQVDALGVAAALQVEDAPFGPAVLIIPHQPALGICRKGGFARPR